MKDTVYYQGRPAPRLFARYLQAKDEVRARLGCASLWSCEFLKLPVARMANLVFTPRAENPAYL